MLRKNGYSLNGEEKETVRFMVEVDTKDKTLEEIAIKKNSKKVK